MQRHRDERGALVLAGREQHVELARIGIVGDRSRQAQQFVGRIAHRGHDDDELRTGRSLAGDPPGDTPNPIRVGQRGATELLDDKRRGHGGHSTSGLPGPSLGRGAGAGAEERAPRVLLPGYQPMIDRGFRHRLLLAEQRFDGQSHGLLPEASFDDRARTRSSIAIRRETGCLRGRGGRPSPRRARP